MIRGLSFLLLLLIFSQHKQATVQYGGALKNIMQKGDLSPYVSLDTIPKDNLYGLGVAEGLQGEIITIAGKTILSSIKEDTIQTKTRDDIKACMYVYANVGEWAHVTDIKQILNMEDLQNQLQLSLEATKLDPEMAYPFMIETEISSIKYHVIHWQKGSIHTRENHRQFAKEYSVENKKVLLLGFYSRHHGGIFTPHNSNLHLHVFDPTNNIVGHVDEISASQPVRIQLP